MAPVNRSPSSIATRSSGLGLQALLSSGVNYRDWLTDVQEMADFNLECKNYYFRNYSGHRVDNIARAILRISLSREIKAKVDGLDSSFEIMNAIRLPTNVSSQIRLKEVPGPQSLIERISVSAKDRTVKSNQTDHSNTAQRAGENIEKIKGREAAQQQQVAPSTFASKATVQAQRSASIESNHLIGTCPVPASPNQQTVPGRNNHYPSPQYTAYYPILAPPIPPTSFHPPPAKPTTSPASNLRPADIYRPVYPRDTRASLTQRPEAREAEVNMPADQPLAQIMEDDGINGQPLFSDLNFSAVSPSAYAASPALFDTGATHHLTGDI
ncbi:hypothetical protein PTTG_02426, partial [Puccinia triticina 1-1 BBBD Race 1]